MIVDLDGKHVDLDTGDCEAVDRTFAQGEGLIETIRAKNGQPLRFDTHMIRLRDGSKLLSMTVPTMDAAIANRIDGVLKANALQDAIVRVIISGDEDAPIPSLLIAAEPRPPMDPVRAILACSTARDEHSPLNRIRSLNDATLDAARQETVDFGADEALLLNNQGRLAEATDANVFLLIDGALVTPPLSDGAYPDILREDLLGKFRGQEISLEVDDLGQAEEAFLVNALGIRPLIEVANQPIGDGAPGLVTQMLATRL